MKLKDLEPKTEKELLELLIELEKKQRDLSFDLKLGKLQNTSQLSKQKRDLARIKMILKNKFSKKI